MADIRDTAPHRTGPAAGSALRWLNGPRGTQGVLAAGLAVLIAAGATVVLHSADPASADTVVAVARLAQVYLPDGTNHPAVEGEVLPRGAELHTGPGGGAQLTTAGRRVYLDGLSTLRIRDGVREDLTRGNAMVDARNGAHLDLQTPAGLVATPAHAVSRVEEGQLLTRVAVYDGAAALRPVGRATSTVVPALYQVKIQPSSLPQRTTPLRLLPGDAWEKAVAADLVNADQDLNSLADGLARADGRTYLAALPAAYRTVAIPAPGPTRGEAALSAAVALAATVTDPLAKVRAYRADQGSWGVVAALVGALPSRVSTALSAALAPPGGDPTGPTTVNAIPPLVLPSGPTTTPSPGAGGPSTRPTTGPTTTPTPSTSPSPGVVNQLVTTVTGLVSPKPLPPARPVDPSQSTKPCVLGLVLC